MINSMDFLGMVFLDRAIDSSGLCLLFFMSKVVQNDSNWLNNVRLELDILLDP